MNPCGTVRLRAGRPGEKLNRYLVVTGLVILAGCQCRPENVPCYAPSLGQGVDEEVCIPGGTYTIGADALSFPSYFYPDGGVCSKELLGKNGCRQPEFWSGPHNDWAPRHLVHLSPYFIDKFEVTNGQFRKCMEAGACKVDFPQRLLDPSFADLPEGAENWQQAHDYCMWREKRLPTEAEWETAARGNQGFDHPWGNGNRTPEPFGPADHYFLLPFGSDPVDVSPFGVNAMGGGVLEWVNDWYDGNYYSVSPIEDPQGPTGPSTGRIQTCPEPGYLCTFSWNGERVLRPGGSEVDVGAAWDPARQTPTWIRHFVDPAAGGGIGFRCARGNRKPASSQSGLESVPMYRNLEWQWLPGPRRPRP